MNNAMSVTHGRATTGYKVRAFLTCMANEGEILKFIYCLKSEIQLPATRSLVRTIWEPNPFPPLHSITPESRGIKGRIRKDLDVIRNRGQEFVICSPSCKISQKK